MFLTMLKLFLQRAVVSAILQGNNSKGLCSPGNQGTKGELPGQRSELHISLGSKRIKVFLRNGTNRMCTDRERDSLQGAGS